jgi:ribosomal protein S18 acetylase RimI-like enzyme
MTVPLDPVVNIRPVLALEYPAFYALMRENMQRYHERYDIAWDQQWTESNYRDKHNYAICRRTEAVGFLSLEWQPGQLYIHTLQLSPDVQGRFYGARVFAWLKTLATERGVATIVCKSFKDNPALAMYRKMGLEIVETQGILVQLAVAVDRVWLPAASK